METGKGEEEYRARFAENLALLRLSAGMTSRQALADATGVHLSSIQRWETGETLPNAYDVARLVKALDITPGELLDPAPLSERDARLMRRRVHRAVDRALREP